MDPISIALGLAQFVPGLTRLLMGDKAGKVADQVVKAATTIAGTDNPQEAIAYLNANPELQLKLQQELNHIVIAELEAETKQLEAINMTMQVEYTSGDKFVRRWRPFFGYIIALTWAAQMCAIAWVIIVKPDQSPIVINAMGSLTGMWGIALAVLGVYVGNRSKEKAAALGATPPPNLLNAMASKFLHRTAKNNG